MTLGAVRRREGAGEQGETHPDTPRMVFRREGVERVDVLHPARVHDVLARYHPWLHGRQHAHHQLCEPVVWAAVKKVACIVVRRNHTSRISSTS